MIISTTNRLPDKKVYRVIGVVSGNTVRTRWIGRDIAAGLKTIIGGEIKGYAEMITLARKDVMRQMEEKAKQKGANAIIGVRYSTTSVMGGAAEILVYGTAVKVK